MNEALLLERVQGAPGEGLTAVRLSRVGEVTAEVLAEHLPALCVHLRDDPALAFDELVDLCGVDYCEYAGDGGGRPRFAVVVHLLSTVHNWRLRVRAYLDSELPLVGTLVNVWASANWFEREAFDLYGVVFDGHPDLRRILTDYGFMGHPFRKDFPLIGEVEMRYDAVQKRVVYEPVSIEPRMTVPRVIRDDHRYDHPDQPERPLRHG